MITLSIIFKGTYNQDKFTCFTNKTSYVRALWLFTVLLRSPKLVSFLSFMHTSRDTLQWNGEELTVALSRTFTESSSATLCFRRASSRVQSGRFSHFPNTTRSMSLNREHTPKSCLKKQETVLLSTAVQAYRLQTSAMKTHLCAAPWRLTVGDCFSEVKGNWRLIITTSSSPSYHTSQASGNGNNFERSKKTSKNTS